MGTRMENSQGLHRKNSGTPLLPLQGSQPQMGKGLRWWPQEDLAVGVNNPAGFQSSRTFTGLGTARSLKLQVRARDRAVTTH